MKTLLIKNWPFYIIGLVIVYGLKRHYSAAGVEDLAWILQPTAWWAKILSGYTFEKVRNIGYVNNANEFIIASSCSGMNFLIILFSTLLYSFIHRFNKNKIKLLWLVLIVILTYLLTIGVNGLRIIFSMYLFNADIYGGLITPERIHTIEGTVIYFVSLFTLFIITERLIGYFVPRYSKHSEDKQPQNSIRSILLTCMYPLFWYFLITLGIPLINKAYRKDTLMFLEHSIVIISVCFISIVSYYLLVLIKNKLRESSQRDKGTGASFYE